MREKKFKIYHYTCKSKNREIRKLRQCKPSLDDEQPHREGMKPRRFWNTFSYGFSIKHLKNFIKSKVGKPWNDVHSEIIDRTSKKDLRIISRFLNEVKGGTDSNGFGYILIDNEPHGLSSWTRWKIYVNEEGVICEAE